MWLSSAKEAYKAAHPASSCSEMNTVVPSGSWLLWWSMAGRSEGNESWSSRSNPRAPPELPLPACALYACLLGDRSAIARSFSSSFRNLRTSCCKLSISDGMGASASPPGTSFVMALNGGDPGATGGAAAAMATSRRDFSANSCAKTITNRKCTRFMKSNESCTLLMFGASAQRRCGVFHCSRGAPEASAGGPWQPRATCFRSTMGSSKAQRCATNKHRYFAGGKACWGLVAFPAFEHGRQERPCLESKPGDPQQPARATGLDSKLIKGTVCMHSPCWASQAC